jgi:hypothetical protein
MAFGPGGLFTFGVRVSYLLSSTQGCLNPDSQDPRQAYCTLAWRKAGNAFACFERRNHYTSISTPVVARVPIEAVAMTPPIGAHAAHNFGSR